MSDSERITALRKALVDNAGQVSEAARSMGISRSLLWFNLRKYGLDTVPATIREKMAKRYRLPPLEKSEKSA